MVKSNKYILCKECRNLMRLSATNFNYTNKDLSDTERVCIECEGVDHMKQQRLDNEKIKRYIYSYSYHDTEKTELLIEQDDIEFAQTANKWFEGVWDEWYEEQREYYQNNKEELAIYQREYAKENREAINAIGQRRRARKKELPATLTKCEYGQTLDDFGNACAYCGTKPKDTLHQEHIVPVVKGGGYTKGNIIPACQSCNSSKGATDFHEWYPKHKHYSEERYEKVTKFVDRWEQHG